MSRNPTALINHILGDVFGLPGIIIFALLLGVGMGLAVQQTNPSRGRIVEVAAASATTALTDPSSGSQSRFSAIPSTTIRPRDRGFESAIVRVRAPACPLPVMAGDSWCD